jgi:hypothetical protein
MSGFTWGWFNNATVSDPASLVPTNGNYCGSGWADGHRLAPNETPKFDVGPLPITVNGVTRPSLKGSASHFFLHSSRIIHWNVGRALAQLVGINPDLQPLDFVTPQNLMDYPGS